MTLNLPVRILILSLCLLASGCFAPFVEGARQGAEVVERDHFQAKAAGGDAESEYKLGNTYCCESGPKIERSLSVFDNQKATEWLCRAALQNYAPAQYKIAQIYAGKATGSGGMITRVSGWLDSDTPDPSVAWVWASLAASNKVEKAAALRDSLSSKLSEAQTKKAKDALQHWQSAPCLWSDVLKTSTAAR